MTHLGSAVLAASTVRNIGIVISLIVGVGFIVYGLINIRAGRREIGSEIELAPNRKPYYDDEQLEGPRLDRALATGIVMLGVVALALPLYWLNEPGRQADAVEGFQQTFIAEGEELFATTEEGGFNCAGCHGAEGVGGLAPTTVTEEDGTFVATMSWKAPALNTVMSRFSAEEVNYILVYGRPFSPMPPWGAEGGGPLTTQQIESLIAYIESIQLEPSEARSEVEGALRKELGLEEDEEIDYQDPEVGGFLFNLGGSDGFAGGAYACARCHTRGWSLTGPSDPEDADLDAFTDYADGSGAMGPPLELTVPRQFSTYAEQLEFVCIGSEEGVQYGRNGQGSGKMPGYCDDPDTDEADDDGMMTEDMAAAIVCYEATFSADDVETANEECFDEIEAAREEEAKAEAEAEAEAESASSADSTATEEEGLTVTIGSVIAGFAWDPQIRGFLAVGVGVVVLMGSVYLLLATNVANRLGFLLAVTGLMGWMTIMGVVWWVFGIGMRGADPSWQIQEVSFDTSQAVTDPVRDLDTSELPGEGPDAWADLTPEEFEAEVDQVEPTLGGWNILPESNPAFGEASATVSEDLSADGENRLGEIGVADETEVVYLWAFETGGKTGLPDEPNRFDRIGRFLKNTFWEVQTPPLYAVVQVQPALDVEPEPGQPAPLPEPDPEQPVVSYVLIRDLGDRRFPAAIVTICSGIVFGVLVNMLHRRDRRVAEARGLLPVRA